MKMTMPLVLATVGNTDAHKPDYQKMWSDFKIAHAKSYDSNGAEEARFAILRTNVDDIEVTNAQKLGYKLGMNLFGDLTVQEIVEQYTGARPTGPSFPGKDLGLHAAANVTLPDSIDWVAKGKVTRVKNQGHCGSCWAFSSTGALESAYAIASGNICPPCRNNSLWIAMSEMVAVVVGLTIPSVMQRLMQSVLSRSTPTPGKTALVMHPHALGSSKVS